MLTKALFRKAAKTGEYDSSRPYKKQTIQNPKFTKLIKPNW